MTCEECVRRWVLFDGGYVHRTKEYKKGRRFCFTFYNSSAYHGLAKAPEAEDDEVGCEC